MCGDEIISPLPCGCHFHRKCADAYLESMGGNIGACPTSEHVAVSPLPSPSIPDSLAALEEDETQPGDPSWKTEKDPKGDDQQQQGQGAEEEEQEGQEEEPQDHPDEEPPQQEKHQEQPPKQEQQQQPQDAPKDKDTPMLGAPSNGEDTPKQDAPKLGDPSIGEAAAATAAAASSAAAGTVLETGTLVAESQIAIATAPCTFCCKVFPLVDLRMKGTKYKCRFCNCVDAVSL